MLDTWALRLTLGQGHPALRGPGREVTAMVVHGAIAETILAEAEARSAHLIAMGSHAYGRAPS